MIIKKCFKCGAFKCLKDFYKHKQMKDGHLNKCKSCCIKEVGIHKCICKVCGKEFFTPKSELTSRNGKYGTGRKTCSRKCWYIWNRGENNYKYKKTNISYGGIHEWIKMMLGKPSECVKCKSSDINKMYHWANISGQYKRDINDWQRLCVKCHSKYDLEKRKIIKIKCLVCGKEVETKSKKRKFCSLYCANKTYANTTKT